MKRVLFTIMTLLVLISAMNNKVLADSIITLGPTNPGGIVTNDSYDIRLGETIIVNDYCEVSVYGADWGTGFGKNAGGLGVYTYEYNAPMDSVYFVIGVKVLNTMMEAHNFRNDFGDVICTYGDGYSFAGFVEEYSETEYGLTMAKGRGVSTDVDPLYEKKFYVAVNLPKTVQDRVNEQLIISFSLGGTTFIYRVR